LSASVLIFPRQFFRFTARDVHGETVLKKSLSRGEVLAFFANIPAILIGIETWPAPMIGQRS
jgi:hypothetical protein